MAFQDAINSSSESFEEFVNITAALLRDGYRSIAPPEWVPDSMKPPPPSPRSPTIISSPKGYLTLCGNWISEHRAVSAAVIAFVGTGGFIVWRRRRADRAKRRARRAKNGARTEVVILAGSPHAPLTKSVSLDLERRGFIVYIPVSSLAEEQVIQAVSRADIRALNVDITSPASAEEAVDKLNNFLKTPHHATSSSQAHRLNLAAFILLPSPSYPRGAITNISSMDWSDIINTNLVAPFAMLQAFLPLLTDYRTNLLFLTPGVNSSLTPPSHAPESVVAGALEKYVSTLRKEMSCLNIVDMRLGHFDMGPHPDEKKQLVVSNFNDMSRAELTKSRLQERIAKGSSLRALHNDVFDAVVRGKGRNGTIFVGRGSRTYDLIGRLVPGNVVAWMMGMRQSGAAPWSATKPGDAVDESAQWEKVQ